MHSPAFVQDQADNCNTTTFVDDILMPTMKEMVEEYKVLYESGTPLQGRTLIFFVCVSTYSQRLSGQMVLEMLHVHTILLRTGRPLSSSVGSTMRALSR